MKKTIKVKFTLALLVAMLMAATNTQAASYNLWICGEQVTDANKDDLTVINGVTGKVTYDTTTNTLRLENATITATNKNGIESDINVFTIDVVGNNTITVNGATYSGIFHKSNGAIDGSGTLTVNAPSAKAISAWNGTFFIRNCTVKATGGTDGICGSNSIIRIVNANITAIGSTNGSIHGFNLIVTNECFISSPIGTTRTNGSVTDADGNIIKSEVKITRSYKLYICGETVTDLNKDDLSVIDGVSGIVNYNPETKTLRLENSTITTSVIGILTQMDSLNIEIIGNNTITISDTGTILGISFSNTKSTIFGSGKLTINAPYAAIYPYSSSLTIKNCTITANGANYGFYGYGGSELIIDGATITATGTKYGSIKDFSNGIILTGGSKIMQPVGGKIFSGDVCDSNNVVVKTEVKIEVPKYDLWICGTQVTDNNKDDLSVIPNVTGTVNYNPDTKILTLNNATMNTTGNTCCILSKIDGLTIDVSGTNTLTGNGWSPIAFEGNNSGIIQGSGTLNITNHAADKEAIFIRNGSLNIINCTLNATAGNYGIKGGGNKPLSIDNAIVSATGTNGGSIVGFNALNLLNHSTISEPANAVFNTTQKAICDAGGTIIKETVKIIPAYKIWICDTQVTGENKENLAAIPGVSAGTVKYNPDTKTLRLENATISATGNVNAIRSDIEDLKIEVVGNNNTVESNGWAAIQCNKNSFIQGNGTLNVNNPADDYAIYARNSSLTIKNCIVNATGGRRGITGTGNSGTLTIDNATVTASGAGEGSISRFATISLNGVVISEPTGAVISKGGNDYYAVRNAAGTIITETVIIEPIKLWICGTQVTTENMDNLSTIPGVSAGTLNYNPDTKTLRLENAAITAASDVSAIRSEIEGVNIEVIGNNTVTNNGVSTIKFYQKSGTILGSGTLTVTNQANDFAIYAQNTSLTIKDCTVNATGGRRGITGGSNIGTLTIDNATVTAKGDTQGSISRFAAITLNGVVISEPTGAVISKGGNNYYAVRNAAGTIIKETVIIEPIKLWICGTQVTPENKDNLATVSYVNGTVSGSLSYNPVTKTLRLEDAVINSTAGYFGGILSEIDGLKIELIGNNTVTSNTNHAGIQFGKSASIEGTGALTVNAPNYTALRAFVSLTIKNCTVNATGKYMGIEGYSIGALNIDNATVSATGTNLGSILGFDDIELISCAIVEPSDAEFNPSQRAICAADTIVKTEVKIIPAYNLWICGVQVTPENKDNLSTIPGVSAGTVNYNPDTKTLTLDGATISSSSKHGAIVSMIDRMKIEIIGTNTVTSTINVPGIGFIQTSSNSIEGSGSLTVNAPNFEAIWSRSDTLVIKNCTINAISVNAGFFGEGKLTIDNATVSATGTSLGSILGFDDIELISCAIVEPSDAEFNPSQGAICAADTIVKTEVKIAPAITYDLWICGVQVTSLNKDDLSIIHEVKSGTVKYNSNTKTLRLENAVITSTADDYTGDCIYSEIDGLIIEVVGNNNLTSMYPAIVFDKKSAVIEGGGTLNVNAEDYTGIYANLAPSLTIRNCTVNITGEEYGICGDNGSIEILNIENATVTAVGTNYGSIADFKEINLIDCRISEPAGAKITNGSVTDAQGNIITSEVKIAPAYDLWICGVQVTPENKDNLATVSYVNGTVSGSVSYNPDTKTLRLEDAVINSTAGNSSGISSDIDGLKIELIGDNTVTSNTNHTGIKFGESASIEGTGALTVNAPNYTALRATVSLSIKNCTVNAIGNNTGIEGHNVGALNIENATVTATGTAIGAIKVFSEINLIDCRISEPAGAKITNGSVTDAQGNIIKETVKIVPTGPGTGIDAPNAQAITLYPNPVKDILHIKSEQAVTTIRIYSVDGTYVTQAAGENISEINLTRLPAGIYMVRVEAGEKVSTVRVVKK